MSQHDTSGRKTPVDTQEADDALADRDVLGDVEDHEDDDDDAVEHLWQVRDIQLGLVSGALLLAGFLAGLAGWETVGLVLSGVALLVGGSTFVPGALKKLAKGKLGVGLLMTIGAVGATLLGQVEEAATLAFLFSLS